MNEEGSNRKYSKRGNSRLDRDMWVTVRNRWLCIPFILHIKFRPNEKEGNINVEFVLCSFIL